MRKYKYIGTVNNVSLKGKGIIKIGDVVSFSDQEAAGLSASNWQEVKNVMKKEVKTFSDGQTSKKVYKSKVKEEE